MSQNPQPDYQQFAVEIMEDWPYGDVDGGDLQDIAVKYGLLVRVEGGFNPDVHEDVDCIAEPGDPWYLINYSEKTGTERPTI